MGSAIFPLPSVGCERRNKWRAVLEEGCCIEHLFLWIFCDFQQICSHDDRALIDFFKRLWEIGRPNNPRDVESFLDKAKKIYDRISGGARKDDNGQDDSGSPPSDPFASP